MQISFVIPAYNEEKRLPACLESIQCELKRTHCDAEVIVVDNASTDKTAEVARATTARVVSEKHKGIVWARRAGFLASTGELVANIDADTLLPKGWLAKVLRAFVRNPTLVGFSGPLIYYDLSRFKRFIVHFFYLFGYLSYIINHFILNRGAMLQGGNFIVRRDALERVGGFDTSIEFYGEDTDIARRISKVGKVIWTYQLPIYASGRRLMKEGTIVAGWRYAKNYFSILLRGKPATISYKDIRDE